MSLVCEDAADGRAKELRGGTGSALRPERHGRAVGRCFNMVGFWRRAGMEGGMDTDGEYRQIMLDAIRVCAAYKPKFGKGKDGIALEQFQDLYRDVLQLGGLGHPMHDRY